MDMYESDDETPLAIRGELWMCADGEKSYKVGAGRGSKNYVCVEDDRFHVYSTLSTQSRLIKEIAFRSMKRVAWFTHNPKVPASSAAHGVPPARGARGAPSLPPQQYYYMVLEFIRDNTIPNTKNLAKRERVVLCTDNAQDFQIWQQFLETYKCQALERSAKLDVAYVSGRSHRRNSPNTVGKPFDHDGTTSEESTDEQVTALMNEVDLWKKRANELLEVVSYTISSDTKPIAFDESGGVNDVAWKTSVDALLNDLNNKSKVVKELSTSSTILGSRESEADQLLNLWNEIYDRHLLEDKKAKKDIYNREEQILRIKEIQAVITSRQALQNATSLTLQHCSSNSSSDALWRTCDAIVKEYTYSKGLVDTGSDTNSDRLENLPKRIKHIFEALKEQSVGSTNNNDADIMLAELRAAQQALSRSDSEQKFQERDLQAKSIERVAKETLIAFSDVTVQLLQSCYDEYAAVLDRLLSTVSGKAPGSEKLVVSSEHFKVVEALEGERRAARIKQDALEKLMGDLARVRRECDEEIDVLEHNFARAKTVWENDLSVLRAKLTTLQSAMTRTAVVIPAEDTVLLSPRQELYGDEEKGLDDLGVSPTEVTDDAITRWATRLTCSNEELRKDVVAMRLERFFIWALKNVVPLCAGRDTNCILELVMWAMGNHMTLLQTAARIFGCHAIGSQEGRSIDICTALQKLHEERTRLQNIIESYLGYEGVFESNNGYDIVEKNLQSLYEEGKALQRIHNVLGTTNANVEVVLLDLLEDKKYLEELQCITDTVDGNRGQIVQVIKEQQYELYQIKDSLKQYIAKGMDNLHNSDTTEELTELLPYISEMQEALSRAKTVIVENAALAELNYKIYALEISELQNRITLIHTYYLSHPHNQNTIGSITKATAAAYLHTSSGAVPNTILKQQTDRKGMYSHLGDHTPSNPLSSNLSIHEQYIRDIEAALAELGVEKRDDNEPAAAAILRAAQEMKTHKEDLNNKLNEASEREEDLNNKLNDAAQRAEDLSNKLNDAAQRAEDLSNKLNDAAQREEDLSNKLYDAAQREEELSNKLNDAAEREEDLSNKLNDAAQREEELSNKLNDAAQREEDLSNKLNDAAQREEDLSNKLNDAAQREEDLNNKLNDAAQREEDLSNKLNDAAQREEELSNKLYDAAQREEDLSNKLNDAAQREEDLSNKLNDAAQREEDLSNKLHDAAQREEDLKNRINDAAQRAEDLSNKLNDAAQREEDLSNKLYDAAQREEELSNKLNDAAQREQDLSNKLNDAAQREEDLSNKLHDAAQREEDLNNKLNDAAQREEDLSNKLYDAAQREEELSNKLNDAAQHEEDLSNKLNDAAQREEDLSNKLHDAAQREEDLNNKLNDAAQREEDLSNKLYDAAQREEELSNKLNDAAQHEEDLSNKLNDAAQREQDLSNKLNDAAQHEEDLSNKLNDAAQREKALEEELGKLARAASTLQRNLDACERVEDDEDDSEDVSVLAERTAAILKRLQKGAADSLQALALASAETSDAPLLQRCHEVAREMGALRESEQRHRALVGEEGHATNGHEPADPSTRAQCLRGIEAALAELGVEQRDDNEPAAAAILRAAQEMKTHKEDLNNKLNDAAEREEDLNNKLNNAAEREEDLSSKLNDAAQREEDLGNKLNEAAKREEELTDKLNDAAQREKAQEEELGKLARAASTLQRNLDACERVEDDEDDSEDVSVLAERTAAILKRLQKGAADSLQALALASAETSDAPLLQRCHEVAREMGALRESEQRHRALVGEEGHATNGHESADPSTRAQCLRGIEAALAELGVEQRDDNEPAAAAILRAAQEMKTHKEDLNNKLNDAAEREEDLNNKLNNAAEREEDLSSKLNDAAQREEDLGNKLNEAAKREEELTDKLNDAAQREEELTDKLYDAAQRAEELTDKLNDAAQREKAQEEELGKLARAASTLQRNLDACERVEDDEDDSEDVSVLAERTAAILKRLQKGAADSLQALALASAETSDAPLLQRCHEVAREMGALRESEQRHRALVGEEGHATNGHESADPSTRAQCLRGIEAALAELGVEQRDDNEPAAAAILRAAQEMKTHKEDLNNKLNDAAEREEDLNNKLNDAAQRAEELTDKLYDAAQREKALEEELGKLARAASTLQRNLDACERVEDDSEDVSVLAERTAAVLKRLQKGAADSLQALALASAETSDAPLLQRCHEVAREMGALRESEQRHRALVGEEGHATNGHESADPSTRAQCLRGIEAALAELGVEQRDDNEPAAAAIFRASQEMKTHKEDLNNKLNEAAEREEDLCNKLNEAAQREEELTDKLNDAAQREKALEEELGKLARAASTLQRYLDACERVEDDEDDSEDVSVLAERTAAILKRLQKGAADSLQALALASAETSDAPLLQRCHEVAREMGALRESEQRHRALVGEEGHATNGHEPADPSTRAQCLRGIEAALAELGVEQRDDNEPAAAAILRAAQEMKTHKEDLNNKLNDAAEREEDLNNKLNNAAEREEDLSSKLNDAAQREEDLGNKLNEAAKREEELTDKLYDAAQREKALEEELGKLARAASTLQRNLDACERVEDDEDDSEDVSVLAERTAAILKRLQKGAADSLQALALASAETSDAPLLQRCHEVAREMGALRESEQRHRALVGEEGHATNGHEPADPSTRAQCLRGIEAALAELGVEQRDDNEPAAAAILRAAQEMKTHKEDLNNKLNDAAEREEDLNNKLNNAAEREEDLSSKLNDAAQREEDLGNKLNEAAKREEELTDKLNDAAQREEELTDKLYDAAQRAEELTDKLNDAAQREKALEEELGKLARAASTLQRNLDACERVEDDSEDVSVLAERTAAILKRLQKGAADSLQALALASAETSDAPLLQRCHEVAREMGALRESEQRHRALVGEEGHATNGHEPADPSTRAQCLRGIEAALAELGVEQRDDNEPAAAAILRAAQEMKTHKEDLNNKLNDAAEREEDLNNKLNNAAEREEDLSSKLNDAAQREEDLGNKLNEAAKREEELTDKLNDAAQREEELTDKLYDAAQRAEELTDKLNDAAQREKALEEELGKLARAASTLQRNLDACERVEDDSEDVSVLAERTAAILKRLQKGAADSLQALALASAETSDAPLLQRCHEVAREMGALRESEQRHRALVGEEGHATNGHEPADPSTRAQCLRGIEAALAELGVEQRDDNEPAAAAILRAAQEMKTHKEDLNNKLNDAAEREEDLNNKLNNAAEREEDLSSKLNDAAQREEDLGNKLNEAAKREEELTDKLYDAAQREKAQEEELGKLARAASTLQRYLDACERVEDDEDDSEDVSVLAERTAAILKRLQKGAADSLQALALASAETSDAPLLQRCHEVAREMGALRESEQRHRALVGEEGHATNGHEPADPSTRAQCLRGIEAALAELGVEQRDDNEPAAAAILRAAQEMKTHKEDLNNKLNDAAEREEDLNNKLNDAAEREEDLNNKLNNAAEREEDLSSKLNEAAQREEELTDKLYDAAQRAEELTDKLNDAAQREKALEEELGKLARAASTLQRNLDACERVEDDSEDVSVLAERTAAILKRLQKGAADSLQALALASAETSDAPLLQRCHEVAREMGALRESEQRHRALVGEEGHATNGHEPADPSTRAQCLRGIEAALAELGVEQRDDNEPAAAAILRAAQEMKTHKEDLNNKLNDAAEREEDLNNKLNNAAEREEDLSSKLNEAAQREEELTDKLYDAAQRAEELTDKLNDAAQREKALEEELGKLARAASTLQRNLDACERVEDDDDDSEDVSVLAERTAAVLKRLQKGAADSLQALALASAETSDAPLLQRCHEVAREMGALRESEQRHRALVGEEGHATNGHESADPSTRAQCLRGIEAALAELGVEQRDDNEPAAAAIFRASQEMKTHKEDLNNKLNEAAEREEDLRNKLNEAAQREEELSNKLYDAAQRAEELTDKLYDAAQREKALEEELGKLARAASTLQRNLDACERVEDDDDDSEDVSVLAERTAAVLKRLQKGAADSLQALALASAETSDAPLLQRCHEVAREMGALRESEQRHRALVGEEGHATNGHESADPSTRAQCLRGIEAALAELGVEQRDDNEPAAAAIFRASQEMKTHKEDLNNKLNEAAEREEDLRNKLNEAAQREEELSNKLYDAAQRAEELTDKLNDAAQREKALEEELGKLARAASTLQRNLVACERVEDDSEDVSVLAARTAAILKRLQKGAADSLQALALASAETSDAPLLQRCHEVAREMGALRESEQRHRALVGEEGHATNGHESADPSTRAQCLRSIEAALAELGVEQRDDNEPAAAAILRAAQEMKTHKEDLSNKLNDAAQREEDLSNKLNDAAQRAEELTDKLNDAAEHEEKLNVKLHDAAQREEDLSNKLNEAAQREEELTDKLYDAAQREEDLNNKLYDAAQREEDLSNKLNDAAHREELLNNKLNDAAHREELLNNKLNDAAQLAEELTDKLNDAAQHEEDLNNKLNEAAQREEDLSNKLNDAAQRAEELTDKLNDAAQREKAQEEELGKLARAASTLQRNLDACERVEDDEDDSEDVSVLAERTAAVLKRLQKGAADSLQALALASAETSDAPLLQRCHEVAREMGALRESEQRHRALVGEEGHATNGHESADPSTRAQCLRSIEAALAELGVEQRDDNEPAAAAILRAAQEMKTHKEDLNNKLNDAAEREENLNNKLNNAAEREEDLSSKLNEAAQREEELTDKVNDAAQREEDLNNKLYDAAQREEKLNVKLNDAAQREEDLNNKLNDAAEHEEKLNVKLHDAAQREEDLNNKLNDAEQREEDLSNKLNEAAQREEELTDKLYDAAQRAEELTDKLNDAAQREKALEEELGKLARAASTLQRNLDACERVEDDSEDVSVLAERTAAVLKRLQKGAADSLQALALASAETSDAPLLQRCHEVAREMGALRESEQRHRALVGEEGHATNGHESADPSTRAQCLRSIEAALAELGVEQRDDNEPAAAAILRAAQEMKTHKEDLNNKLNDAAEREEDLSNKLNDAAQRAEELTDKLNDAAQREEDLNNKVNDAAQREEDLNNKLYDAAQREEKLNVKLHDAAQREEDLNNKLNDAEQREEDLSNKLNEAAQREEELTDKLYDAAQREEDLNNKLYDAAQREEDLNNKLNDAAQREEDLTDKLYDAAQREEDLGNKLNDAAQRAEELTDKLNDAAEREEDLSNKLNDAAQREEDLNNKLYDAAQHEEDLSNKLNNAAEREEDLGNKLNEAAKREEELTDKLNDAAQREKALEEELGKLARAASTLQRNLDACERVEDDSEDVSVLAERTAAVLKRLQKGAADSLQALALASAETSDAPLLQRCHEVAREMGALRESEQRHRALVGEEGHATNGHESADPSTRAQCLRSIEAALAELGVEQRDDNEPAAAAILRAAQEMKTHKEDLNNKLNDAAEREEDLSNKLNDAAQRAEELTDKLNDAAQREEDLNNKVNDAAQREEKLNVKLNDAAQREEDLNNKLNDAAEHEEKLNVKLHDAAQREEDLNNKLNDAEQREEDLSNKLNEAAQREEELTDKLYDAAQREEDLNNKLNDAAQREEDLTDKLYDAAQREEDLGNKLNDAAQRAEELTDKLNDAAEREEDLSNKLNDAAQRAEELTDKLNDAAQREKALEEELGKLARAASTLQRNLDACERVEDDSEDVSVLAERTAAVLKRLQKGAADSLQALALASAETSDAPLLQRCHEVAREMGALRESEQRHRALVGEEGHATNGHEAADPSTRAQCLRSIEAALAELGVEQRDDNEPAAAAILRAAQEIKTHKEDLNNKLNDAAEREEDLSNKLNDAAQRAEELTDKLNDAAQREEDLNNKLNDAAQREEDLNNKLYDAAQREEKLNVKLNDAAQREEDLNNKLNDAAQREEDLSNKLNEAAQREEDLSNKLNDAAQRAEELTDKLNDAAQREKALEEVLGKLARAASTLQRNLDACERVEDDSEDVSVLAERTAAVLKRLQKGAADSLQALALASAETSDAPLLQRCHEVAREMGALRESEQRHRALVGEEGHATNGHEAADPSTRAQCLRGIEAALAELGVEQRDDNEPAAAAILRAAQEMKTHKEDLNNKLNDAAQREEDLSNKLNEAAEREEELTDKLYDVAQREEDLSNKLNNAAEREEDLGNKLNEAAKREEELTDKLNDAAQREKALEEELGKLARAASTLQRNLDACERLEDDEDDSEDVSVLAERTAAVLKRLQKGAADSLQALALASAETSDAPLLQRCHEVAREMGALRESEQRHRALVGEEGHATNGHKSADPSTRAQCLRGIEAALAELGVEQRDDNEPAAAAILRAAQEMKTHKEDLNNKLNDAAEREEDLNNKLNNAAEREEDLSNKLNDAAEREEELTDKLYDAAQRAEELTDKLNDAAEREEDLSNKLNDAAQRAEELTDKLNDAAQREKALEEELGKLARAASTLQRNLDACERLEDDEDDSEDVSVLAERTAAVLKRLQKGAADSLQALALASAETSDAPLLQRCHEVAREMGALRESEQRHRALVGEEGHATNGHEAADPSTRAQCLRGIEAALAELGVEQRDDNEPAAAAILRAAQEMKTHKEDLNNKLYDAAQRAEDLSNKLNDAAQRAEELTDKLYTAAQREEVLTGKLNDAAKRREDLHFELRALGNHQDMLESRFLDCVGALKRSSLMLTESEERCYIFLESVGLPKAVLGGFGFSLKTLCELCTSLGCGFEDVFSCVTALLSERDHYRMLCGVAQSGAVADDTVTRAECISTMLRAVSLLSPSLLDDETLRLPEKLLRSVQSAAEDRDRFRVASERASNDMARLAQHAGALEEAAEASLRLLRGIDKSPDSAVALCRALVAAAGDAAARVGELRAVCDASVAALSTTRPESTAPPPAEYILTERCREAAAEILRLRAALRAGAVAAEEAAALRDELRRVEASRDELRRAASDLVAHVQQALDEHPDVQRTLMDGADGDVAVADVVRLCVARVAADQRAARVAAERELQLRRLEDDAAVTAGEVAKLRAQLQLVLDGRHAAQTDHSRQGAELESLRRQLQTLFADALGMARGELHLELPLFTDTSATGALQGLRSLLDYIAERFRSGVVAGAEADALRRQNSALQEAARQRTAEARALRRAFAEHIAPLLKGGSAPEAEAEAEAADAPLRPRDLCAAGEQLRAADRDMRHVVRELSRCLGAEATGGGGAAEARAVAGRVAAAADGLRAALRAVSRAAGAAAPVDLSSPAPAVEAWAEELIAAWRGTERFADAIAALVANRGGVVVVAEEAAATAAALRASREADLNNSRMEQALEPGIAVPRHRAVFAAVQELVQQLEARGRTLTSEWQALVDQNNRLMHERALNEQEQGRIHDHVQEMRRVVQRKLEDDKKVEQSLQELDKHLDMQARELAMKYRSDQDAIVRQFADLRGTIHRTLKPSRAK